MEFGLDNLHDANFDSYNWTAIDDVSEEELDHKLLMEARCEELKYFKDTRVYEYATIDECKNATGRPPIGVRWAEINRRDRARPNYRARMVAKDYRTEHATFSSKGCRE